MKKLNIYLIGIGGIGVGGLAEVLFAQGHGVSGEDLAENTVVRRLQTLGVKVHIAPDDVCVKDVDLVVYSAAVSSTHPVLVQAKQLNIKSLSRAEMLAQLVQNHQVIACTGTHGKTTTTSLIAHLLDKNDLDPGYFIGGKVPSLSGLARIGEGDWVAVEADESDASFVTLSPTIAVITNVDPDHLENFPGGFDGIRSAFLDFIACVQEGGHVILCLDNAGAKSLLPHIDTLTQTYGFHEEADVKILSYDQQGLTGNVLVQFPGELPQSFKVALPGAHNALNAVAALMVMRLVCQQSPLHAQSEHAKSYPALADFSGVDKRMQIHGRLPIDSFRHDSQHDLGAVLLVEDYGHHPVELDVTLKSIKHAWPKSRVIWVFQPHRYTRTAAFLDAFSEVLCKVDAVILLPVYAASEDPSLGANSHDLARQIHKKNKAVCHVLEDRSHLHNALTPLLQDGDILVLQGAGDIAESVLALAKRCVAC